MAWLLFLLTALLALKLLWNIAVAYRLALELWKSSTGRTRTESLACGVDLLLLVLLISVSSVLGPTDFPLGPWQIAMWGLLAIVASYAHLFVVGTLAGIFRKRFK